MNTVESEVSALSLYYFIHGKRQSTWSLAKQLTMIFENTANRQKISKIIVQEPM